MEVPSLQSRLDAAKAAQFMRSRLSVATRKLKSDHPSLPFPDLQPPPTNPLSPAFVEEPVVQQPSQTALGKRKLVEPAGLGYGADLGDVSREESALGGGGGGTRGGSIGAQTSRTTPKQNLYEMMLGPRPDRLDQHDDGGGLGGLGYGFPSTSSGTNGTSSFHNYRGVSSTHHRNQLPPPTSSSPYDQPYDNPPMSPSLYLNSPDPNQFSSSSSFFPSSSNHPFPLRPRTPSSSTRDETTSSKPYSSIFPSSSYGHDSSNDNSDPFIVSSTGPRHLEAPYSPRRGPRIVSDSGSLNFAAASPRGIGLGGAFGRSPSATYSSSSHHHLNANPGSAAGAAASFSFAQNHTTSPVITSSPKMSSSRTSMMPSRPPPIASPSGPLYPSSLGIGGGGGGAGVFPPRFGPGGASPSSFETGAGTLGQPQRAGGGGGGHRRAISSTLSAVVNFQASRRPVANNNTSPERKRRLPSGGHFSPSSSSPDKKKRRSLSYGALPPPELPLRKKNGASRLGTTDVSGLEESAASALASMLASSSSSTSYGSGGVGGEGGGSAEAVASVGGGSGRVRSTGTPPPPPSGADADASAAGMLIFLHHSPSPAKTKSSVGARTPGGGGGGGMGTPGRGRVLMFDDHPPTPPKPTLAPTDSLSSSMGPSSNPPPASQHQPKPTLSRPPSFTTTPSSSQLQSQEGLVNLSLPSPPPPPPPPPSQSHLYLEPTLTSSQPDAALSPPGPFFSPPLALALTSALPSPLPPLSLSQGSSLDDAPTEEPRERKDAPEDILGSQNKDKKRRALPSPSPTLAPRVEIQQGPTPSWPDFDFLTSSSGERTPTPPLASGGGGVGDEKISGSRI
ncbi:hypothetical protein BDY24DRAFT_438002 [Mrakia frigida]|uniref:uncharacterized protein n=1 Tax=Mrakia frigida TaxID=29902 RepID=UPI003FCC20C3